MTVLSKAEDLNAEIEEKAAKVCALSEKILSKLRKFKDNQFRPRIQGYDSDSETEDNEETGERKNSKVNQNKITIKGLTKAGRSPTKYLNKINSEHDEEDNIALLKLIRGGYIDQQVMANLISNVVTGFNQQLKPVKTNDEKPKSKDKKLSLKKKG